MMGAILELCSCVILFHLCCLCFGMDGSKIPFCTQTVTTDGVSDSSKVTVQATNVTIKDSLDYSDIKIDVCSERADSNLKLTWYLTPVKGNQEQLTMTLCLRQDLQVPRQDDIIDCYTLTAKTTHRNSTMQCWINLVSVDKKHRSSTILQSFVSFEEMGVNYNFYGETDFKPDDLNKTCSFCASLIPTFVISSQYVCNTTGLLTHHQGLTVLSLMLKDDNNTTYLRFRSKDGNLLEFHVADVAMGFYRLSIITKDSSSDIYCGYNKTIYIVCGQGTGDGVEIEPPQPFESFVVFGIICCVIIIMFVTFSIVVIQFAAARRRRALRNRARAQRSASRVSNRPAEEEIPLNDINNASAQRSSPQVSNQQTQKTLLIDLNNEVASNGTCDLNGTNQGSMPREFSEKLQDINRDSSNKTSILFLPIPFDDYTRNIMNLLRRILTVDGQSKHQCVFDIEESNKYSQNKFDWIESITADNNKIIMFLCFTSLEGKREPNIVDELMEHFKKIKRPHCHVIFVHVTDNNTDLGDLYPGYAVNVMHDNGLKDLIKKVLSIVGLRPDNNYITKIMKSEDSKELLNLIGHRKHVHKYSAEI